MLITATLLGICICLFVAYLWKLRSYHDYFIRRNIPGPPPQFFFGHFLTLWNTPSYMGQLREWARQYGSIYGIFEGTRPLYVVSDIDFLQEVYVKQFSSFNSRRLNFIHRLNLNNAIDMFAAHGDQWRRQRQVINPTFTPVKMKTMTPLMNKCIESLMKKLDGMDGNEFNIHELYKRLTMDVMWNCAFGVETDMQNDAGNICMEKSIACVEINNEKLALVKLSYLMPFLIPLLRIIIKASVIMIRLIAKFVPSLVGKKGFHPVFWVVQKVEETVNERMISGEKRMDFIQLMLEAAAKDDIKDNGAESKRLHYNEVVMNVFFFMIGGFETTSSFLGYCTYALAQHPDIQDKLRNEIDEHWKENEGLDYEQVSDLTYMDLFIREVLRMYKIAGNTTTRVCNTATTVCGHQIDKDCVIHTDVYAIHYNPDLWGPEDPKLFIPERHTVKRHPLAYMPFGVGPRNCLGMRFALMALKMSIARLVRTHTILPSRNVGKSMVLREKFTVAPEAIYVRLEKRSSK